MHYESILPFAHRKMILREQGLLLNEMQLKLAKRVNEDDYSPFYDDFENGIDKWELTYTSSDQYVFKTINDPEDSSNSVLQASGYSMFYIPLDEFWPSSGKMVKLKLRLKYAEYNKLNIPYMIYSYKDVENFYASSTISCEPNCGSS